MRAKSLASLAAFWPVVFAGGCRAPAVRPVPAHVNPVVKVRYRGERPLPAERAIEVRTNTGSGILVAPSGLVVTNHHVVARPGYETKRLTVIVDAGTPRAESWAAEVVRFDHAGDLALLALRPPASGLPVVRLGRAAALRPGLPVRALGYPRGGAYLESSGVVTRHEPSDRTGMRKAAVEATAFVTTGNSGGPLVAPDGSVLAIVHRKRVGDRDAVRAVPVDYLRRRLAQWGVEAPRSR